MVLPVGVLKEYMTALHLHTSHSGIQKMVAKAMKSVFCLTHKSFQQMAKEVCKSCEGCSMNKRGPDHRSERDVSFSGSLSRVVRVDEAMGRRRRQLI